MFLKLRLPLLNRFLLLWVAKNILFRDLEYPYYPIYIFEYKAMLDLLALFQVLHLH